MASRRPRRGKAIDFGGYSADIGGRKKQKKPPPGRYRCRPAIGTGMPVVLYLDIYLAAGRRRIVVLLRVFLRRLGTVNDNVDTTALLGQTLAHLLTLLFGFALKRPGRFLGTVGDVGECLLKHLRLHNRNLEGS
jgi:hypothetical protein